MSKMEEVSTKKVRLFAPYVNKEHLEEARNNIYNVIPETMHWDLTLFIGQLESTIVEGFADDNK